MGSDLMQRLQFCLQHQSAGSLTPPQLMAEAFKLLEDQQARIAALEAVVDAGDGLAEAVGLYRLTHRSELRPSLDAALTAYRAAKEAANG